MEEREYIISLYEYYGNLLTNKQQSIFNDYYYDNLTMEEISFNNNVSKNAISKQLINIKNKLSFYEDKLRLYYKSSKITNLLDQNTLNKIDKYI